MAKKKKAGKVVLPGRVVGSINGFPIRRVRAAVLKGAPYNPREISEEALGGLRVSVDEFGMTQPIVWNKRTRRIVGGHQRLKTLPPDVATDVVEVDLPEEKEKALNLALNNPHTAGEFTVELGEILQGLQAEIPDLSENLRLDELFVDVPVDVDELLEENDGGPRETETEPESGETKPRGKKLHQIVLVFDEDEHEEVTEMFDAVIKNEDEVDSFTTAVAWLLRWYRDSD